MIWANFIHIYQPPTQKKYWIDKITHESYRPVFAGLLQIPSAKIVLNINAVLAELLIQHGHKDVIEMIRKLAQNGQLEFTASAKYHPLLPKLPKDEVIRQIRLNEETNKKIFGKVYEPKGFFPPEMAFSMDVAKIVASLGYDWIIADELSYPLKDEQGNRLPVDYSKTYTIKGLGDCKIYFRERQTSHKILSFQFTDAQYLVKDLKPRLAKQEYLLTAMDGETFGHHRLGLEQVLFDMYKSEKLTSVFISELPNFFKETVIIEPLPSTWALMEKDLEMNLPFSRWDDADNKIHALQWRLLDLAVTSVKEKKGKLAKSQKLSKARLLLDQAVHSDQFWWAGAKPWWSIEYIEAGAKQLKDVVLAAPKATRKMKKEAEELYFQIVTTAFDWQRSGKVDQLARAEDEEIRQRVDRALPSMKASEFDQMVASLDVQRRKAAQSQEYERAAQFRNRIAELREQWEKIKLEPAGEGSELG